MVVLYPVHTEGRSGNANKTRKWKVVWAIQRKHGHHGRTIGRRTVGVQLFAVRRADMLLLHIHIWSLQAYLGVALYRSMNP